MDAMRSDEPKQSHCGFTLVELMIVVIVIGIIIAFILTAAMGGIRRAEARATEALISKLEVGIADRLEALTYQQANPTGLNVTPGTVPFTHAGLAEVVTTISTPSPQRAQVIAQFDMVKSELPDVFFVQYGTPAGTNYPLNFVAQRFGLTNTDSDYLLPIGSLSQGTPSTGIFGASYSVAAGIYKNICADKRGFDGLDNDGDGFVDNLTEWGGNLAALNTFVANHKHKTVRAEMLYAILVEGQGQLGSVFNRDEFKNSEIGDTDGDGLPEFVDAWGEPLYFFRWPILYPSDLQKGYAPPPGPYGSVFEARQQESLDPNQQLMAPAWWWAGSNAGQAPYATGSIPPSGAPQMSGPAIAFQSIFHALAEPLVVYQTLGANPINYWDRSSTFYPRRAFYSKYLIISSGPDKQLGLPICDVDYYQIDSSVNDGSGAPVSSKSIANLLLESEAAPYDLNRPNDLFTKPKHINQYLHDSGADDISNHNLQAPGGATQ